MPRTHRQRCFDAFHTMAKAATASGVVAVPDPLINLVIDLETFVDATNRLFDQPVAAPDPSRSTTTRCETVDGVPVDPQQIVALAIRAQIRRIVMDEAGRVIELGRSTRLFRGGPRDAVKLTAHRCDQPGCGVPGSQCDIDHVLEWVRDHGGTDSGNGRARCHRHNDEKHRKRWRTRIDEHCVSHTYRADGSEIAPKPPRTTSNEPDEPG
jgi:hypothetical protein